MKTVLITGGAGFVGSYLCKKFNLLGYKVVAADDLSNGLALNLTSDTIFEEIDLSSFSAFNALDKYSFDLIIHCAAQSSNALSFLDIEKDMKSNLISTYNILEYSKKNKIRRLIYTSTLSIYGQPSKIPTPEDCKPKPDAFYSINKLAGEQYVKLFSKHYNIRSTIFRLYTTYGIGQNLSNRNQGLLSIFISYILKNEPIIVKGSLERKRDIVFVEDVVDAIVKSIDSESTFGQTYNLGSGNSLTIREIIDLLIDGLAENSNDYPIIIEDGTLGDPFETLADMTKIKEHIDWEPKIMPLEGIMKTIQSYNKGKK